MYGRRIIYARCASLKICALCEMDKQQFAKMKRPIYRLAFYPARVQCSARFALCITSSAIIMTFETGDGLIAIINIRSRAVCSTTKSSVCDHNSVWQSHFGPAFLRSSYCILIVEIFSCISAVFANRWLLARSPGKSSSLFHEMSAIAKRQMGL